MDPVCFICKNILKGFYVASSRVVVGGSWCFAIFHYGPLDDSEGLSRLILSLVYSVVG